MNFASEPATFESSCSIVFVTCACVCCSRFRSTVDASSDLTCDDRVPRHESRFFSSSHSRVTTFVRQPSEWDRVVCRLVGIFTVRRVTNKEVSSTFGHRAPIVPFTTQGKTSNVTSVYITIIICLCCRRLWMCRWPFPVFATCVTISNPGSLSSSKTCVDSGIRSWENHSSDWARCQKAFGGI